MFELHVLDGYAKGDKFILRGIMEHNVYGVYKADNLRSLARVIGNEAFTYTIDKDKQISVPIDQAIIMQSELNKIADYLESEV